jgi:hypothetical protein
MDQDQRPSLYPFYQQVLSVAFAVPVPQAVTAFGYAGKAGKIVPPGQLNGKTL